MFAIRFWNSSVRMKHLFSGGGREHKDSALSAIYLASCSATADRSEVTIHLRVRFVKWNAISSPSRRLYVAGGERVANKTRLRHQILIPRYDRSGA
jgi:hypothetical protein